MILRKEVEGLARDFLIDGRRSFIWDVRLGILVSVHNST